MDSEGNPIESRTPWRWALALAALVVVAWFSVLDGAFVNDDLTLVARNPTLQAPDGPLELVGQPMWSALPEFSEADRVGHWRPLTSVALWAGYALGGSVRAPGVFHGLSLAFHVLAVVCAWRLARRVLARFAVREVELGAFVCALLFALHPLQTESVAWISALNDPLAAALVFAGLERWLAWRARGGGLPWAASGLFFLALLTKEPAIAFVPLLLVVELCVPRAKSSGSSTPRPFAGMAVVASAVIVWYALRVWVFGDPAAGFFRANASYGGHVWRVREELLGGAVWRTLWPAALAPGEPFREAWSQGAALHTAKLVGFGLFVLGMVAALVQAARGRRALALVVFGFLAALLPPLVAPTALGQTPFAARYAYVAVFFAALGLVLLMSRAQRAALVGVGAVLAVVFAWRVQVEEATWDAPVAFYTRVTEAYPRTPSGWWNLGEVQRERYIDSTAGVDGLDGGIGDTALLESAFAAYETASDLLVEAAQDATIPRDELDHLRTGLGQAWCYLLQAEVDQYKDYDTPQRILEMLLERVLVREKANRQAGSPRPPLPVEEVFNTLGIVKLRAGDRVGAADDFRRALEFAPNYVPALRNLGLARLDAGEYALASQLFAKALALVPGDPEVLEPYARSLFEEGWTESALDTADRLAELEPGNPTPATLRGLDAMKRRDFRAALEQFDRALGLAPREPIALYQRGMALEQLGETDEAIAALRRAAEADPKSFPAHYNLGRMLLAAGAYDAARPYLERAYVVGDGRPELAPVRDVLLQLDPDNAPRMREFAEVDDERANVQGALFWTDRALALEPDNGRSRHLKGRLLMAAGENVLALPELVRASELLPKGYVIFEDLGQCNANLGRYPESRAAYGRAIELIEAQQYGGAASDPAEVKAAWQQLQASAIAKLEARLRKLPPVK